MKLILTLTAIVFIISSCDKNRVYEKNIEVTDYIQGWKSDDVKTFDIKLDDTTVLYNLFINIRHAEVYPFSNIWLMLNTKFPNGKTNSQRIEIPLADENGNWFGDGMGDIWDYRFALSPFYIQATGTYTISVAHDMRMDPLPGIMDVGIRIENTGEMKNNQSTKQNSTSNKNQ